MEVSVMKVSAVGFLFQNDLKDKSLKGKNYTCVIHKKDGQGNYTRNLTSSPLVKTTRIDVVTPRTAELDVLGSLAAISDENSDDKFIGAAIKDGKKETEIHSLISDKIYAVRTKDANGKNRFQVLNKEQTKGVIAHNLYLNA